MLLLFPFSGASSIWPSPAMISDTITREILFSAQKKMSAGFFSDQGFKVQWQDTGRAYLDDWVYISNPQF